MKVAYLVYRLHKCAILLNVSCFSCLPWTPLDFDDWCWQQHWNSRGESWTNLPVRPLLILAEAFAGTAWFFTDVSIGATSPCPHIRVQPAIAMAATAAEHAFKAGPLPLSVTWSIGKVTQPGLVILFLHHLLLLQSSLSTSCASEPITSHPLPSLPPMPRGNLSPGH